MQLSSLIAQTTSQEMSTQYNEDNSDSFDQSLESEDDEDDDDDEEYLDDLEPFDEEAWDKEFGDEEEYE